MSELYESEEKGSAQAWYSQEGSESDIVLSSRLRLARNLANFPFPDKFKDDDGNRVRSLVFDAFSHLKNPDMYTGLMSSDLDDDSARILEEQGLLDSQAARNKNCGIIIRTDGKISCTINDTDHLRLSAFLAGMAGNSCFELCRQVDDELQNSLQFAANYDLGFLNSCIKDCGSGLKLSFRLHLPCLSFSGKIKEVFNSLKNQDITIRDCFGAGDVPGTSLGFFYQISNKASTSGNEFDQLASLISFVRYLIENERRERDVVLKNRQTELRDRIYRSFAKVKFASLISLKEGIDIISDIKTGKNLGFFSDVEDRILCGLLYRIQEGHLQFLLKNKKFNFPQDISENRRFKAENVRTMLLQEAFENLRIK